MNTPAEKPKILNHEGKNYWLRESGSYEHGYEKLPEKVVNKLLSSEQKNKQK